MSCGCPISYCQGKKADLLVINPSHKLRWIGHQPNLIYRALNTRFRDDCLHVLLNFWWFHFCWILRVTVPSTVNKHSRKPDPGLSQCSWLLLNSIASPRAAPVAVYLSYCYDFGVQWITLATHPGKVWSSLPLPALTSLVPGYHNSEPWSVLLIKLVGTTGPHEWLDSRSDMSLYAALVKLIKENSKTFEKKKEKEKEMEDNFQLIGFGDVVISLE